MKKIVAGVLAISLVFGAVVPIGCNVAKRDALPDGDDVHYYTFTFPSRR